MDRYGSTIPTKGYSSDISGRKRVQLNADQGKGSYETTGLFHSTPKTKPFSTSLPGTSPSFKGRAGNTSYQTGMSSTRAPRSKSPFRNTSPLGRRSVSPVSQRTTSPPRLLGSSFSPNKQLSDVDSDTIQRQRRELQLLIGELKDRDRELNDMVQAHQKQIVAWEEDRQRVFALEKRCSRFESEIKNRTEQMRALQARIKATEVEEQNKTRELEDTQVQLQHISEQANTSIHQLQELEEKNLSLTSTMRELSNTIGQLQAREQELSTRLKLKDNDIRAANVRLGELQQKVKRMDGICQELKKAETSMRNERDQWRDQALANKQEVEKLRGDISKQFTDADEIQAELGKTKQEVLVLQKELFLAGEREKRKDQLLELQKSKQERTDSELQNLRQICERQQRDISYMQLQLQSSHDTLPTDTRASDLGGDHNEEKTNYLNTDFDDQDGVSPKLMDFDGPLVSNGVDDDLITYLPATGTRPGSQNGATTSLSLHAAAGSDITDDLESLTQEPLQPQPAIDRSYGGANNEGYPSSQPYYTPATRPDVFASLGNLSLSSSKVIDTGSYAPFSRPGEMSAVGDTYPTYSMTSATNAASSQVEDNSPTTKLHRLLAESRQMVHNLEQTSSFSPSGTGSPKQDRVGDPTTDASEQYTPPQRHLGSPLHARGLPNSTE